MCDIPLKLKFNTPTIFLFLFGFARIKHILVMVIAYAFPTDREVKIHHMQMTRQGLDFTGLLGLGNHIYLLSEKRPRKPIFVVFPFTTPSFSRPPHVILTKIRFLRFPKRLWISQVDTFFLWLVKGGIVAK